MREISEERFVFDGQTSRALLCGVVVFPIFLYAMLCKEDNNHSYLEGLQNFNCLVFNHPNCTFKFDD